LQHTTFTLPISTKETGFFNTAKITSLYVYIKKSIMKELSNEEMLGVKGGSINLPIDLNCIIAGSLAVANNFEESEYGSAEAQIIYSIGYYACY
jgi:hypothetical protein